ncbi:hypothetical protein [Streptomyces sp. NPDC091215]|uniref:hypothetical protein n=1 Tax=Streptomyces sp. NPDC091215 TaxID=3155192 RepID=UPI0034132D5F
MDADVELEPDGWESRHRAVYGCGAWERACRQGGLMTAWHQEQDLLFGAPASRRHAAAPGARVKWPWGSGPHTLGLLLWRTAYLTAAGCLRPPPTRAAGRRAGWAD